jgi:hypothetical protein
MNSKEQQLGTAGALYGSIFVFRANGSVDVLCLDAYPTKTKLLSLIGQGYEGHPIVYNGSLCEIVFSKRNQLFEESNNRATKLLRSQSPEILDQINLDCIYGNAIVIKHHSTSHAALSPSEKLPMSSSPQVSIRRGTRA